MTIRELPKFAKKTLFITLKEASAGQEPGNKTLVFNKAQEYIHQRLEEQLIHTGRVRALILKGRQQGCSTYVAARFFHKAIFEKDRKIFILTHRADATSNLFDMVDRFRKNILFELPTTRASKRELIFSKTESGYKVGTAGAKDVGRSMTTHFFHGSEVAFWDNAPQLAAGVLQTIPNAPGTEIILESTANGVGGYFHEQWQMAERGESKFIAIFVPWFWQTEYRTPPPDDFVLSADEVELAELYGLDHAQVCWMRDKRNEIGDTLFKQEYPFNAAEAFQTSGTNTFIRPETVMAARNSEDPEDDGVLIVGCDPARYGDDSTAIAYRRGRVCKEITTHKKLNNMQVAGMLADLIDRAKPAKLFIDLGGGAGIYDRLIELGYRKTVVGINFGESATDSKRYPNMRNEMWDKMKQWLLDQPAKIPDDNALHADLIGPMYTFDSNGRIKLESKEDMRKRGIKSPDRADALALTFAAPVPRDANANVGRKAKFDSIFGN